MTTLLIVVVGCVLPYTPLAGPLGFTPLPALYFLFLAGMVVSYLFLVELVKRRLMRRYAWKAQYILSLFSINVRSGSVCGSLSI